VKAIRLDPNAEFGLGLEQLNVPTPCLGAIGGSEAGEAATNDETNARVANGDGSLLHQFCSHGFPWDQAEMGSGEASRGIYN
jgi:hypothetical protein